MSASFKLLSSQLLYIRWNGNPSREEAEQYLTDLTRYIKEAKQPIYVLSDLRKGHVTDSRILQRMSELTTHPNFGGGTAFGQDVAAGVFAGLFHRLSRNRQRASGIWLTLDEALNYLEELKPGLTKGIDWKKEAP